jgi:prepilin-type N-terminal cleavage/methylation domain-containing protein
MTPSSRLALLLVFLCLPLVAARLPAGEAVAPRPVTVDLREALAHTTRERNDLAARVDRVTAQYWLLIIYGAAMTALALGFGLVLLRRGQRPAAPANGPETIGDDLIEDFSGVTATVRKRRNATITIRNATTQQEEVVGDVQTRRMFARGVASPEPARKATTTRLTRSVSTPAEEPELKPSTDRTTRAADPTPAPQPITNRRTVTVRVEQQQSDRLAQVEVQVKPGTAAVVRQGFSMLEVMIAVAVLATVLSSVLASIYALHTAQVVAEEEARVDELGRLLSERLMGAQWDAIGRRDQSDVNFGAWSWHRRRPVDGEATAPAVGPLREGTDVPDADNLQAIGLLSGPSQLDQLRVYLEFYKRDVLDAVLTSGSGENPRTVWNEQRAIHRIPEESPNDFAGSTTVQTAPTLVFRIVIVWNGYRTGEREREFVFARSK